MLFIKKRLSKCSGGEAIERSDPLVTKLSIVFGFYFYAVQ
jgi:hypothetical protein